MANCTIYEADLDGMFEISFDDVAEKALNESVPILEATMRSAAAAVIKHDGESGMVNSIKGSKPKKVTATDCWIVNVGPRGTKRETWYHPTRGGGKHGSSKFKVSNALLAIWKEYGIPGRQPAMPFMQKATNAARGRVEAIIEDAFNKEIEKYEL